MSSEDPGPDDVLVTLDHPHGAIEVALSEWMRTGPGERIYLRPVAAKDRRTGRALPLSTIPVPYRNTALTRSLVRLGVIADPWRREGGGGRS